jgi:hypothetical protein
MEWLVLVHQIGFAYHADDVAFVVDDRHAVELVFGKERCEIPQ